ncbi:glutathione synthetase ATP-binding domain-like protein [Gonapodya prolifera JEL478]|uniref:Glutathione synthetase ATP-binding domain-like protein n=1 Tax=Gonapodya prolifera (strain JEL478) TaxID=1344416 RepID=A0A139A747_GONPJ|nr:glutathione synthetase ATP-binding domain-like protein [Gonapodya prolifera JEL478]|eukprot:KXS12607.1 glutathione synthetase ATP-binding domain-like protein [Gonapodya prolifera JEL478]
MSQITLTDQNLNAVYHNGEQFDPSTVAIRILDPFLVPGKQDGANADLVFLNEYAAHVNDQLADILRSSGYTDVSVHPTTLANYESIVENIKTELKSSLPVPQGTSKTVVVLNLCDGTENDGYPGPSVLSELERLRIPYTGSNVPFYEISTSKPLIKRHLQAHGVPTSPFIEIDPHGVGTDEEDFDIVGFPLIIKPSLGYASLGIGPHSVCTSIESVLDAVHTTRKLTFDARTFAERFLDGREFTVLLVGTPPGPLLVYPPAERVFSPELDGPDRMLQFDKYWKTDAGSFYSYVNLSADEQELEEELIDIARNAYTACGGIGYGRVDLRTTRREKSTNWEIMVLEVNANPSLAFDPLMSTSGAILNLAKEPASEFLHRIISDALSRARNKEKLA